MTAPQLDDAQRADLAAAAVGLPVAPGSLVTSDVDVDHVIGQQLTHAQLQELHAAGKHDAILQARTDGRLLGLFTAPQAFAGAAPAPSDLPAGQLTDDEVKQMARDGKHTELDQAYREGRLRNIMGGR